MRIPSILSLIRWLTCMSFRGKCAAMAVVCVSCMGLVWAKARGGGSSSSCEDENVTKGPDPAYLEIKYNYINYLLFVSFAVITGLGMLILIAIHGARKRRKLENVRDIARHDPMPMMWATVLLESDAATLKEGALALEKLPITLKRQ